MQCGKHYISICIYFTIHHIHGCEKNELDHDPRVVYTSAERERTFVYEIIKAIEKNTQLQLSDS